MKLTDECRHYLPAEEQWFSFGIKQRWLEMLPNLSLTNRSIGWWPHAEHHQIAAPAYSNVPGTTARVCWSLEDCVQQGQDGDVMRVHWEGAAGLIDMGGRSWEWLVDWHLKGRPTNYKHTHQALYSSQHYAGFMWSAFKHTPHLGLDVAKEKQVLSVLIILLHQSVPGAVRCGCWVPQTGLTTDICWLLEEQNWPLQGKGRSKSNRKEHISKIYWPLRWFKYSYNVTDELLVTELFTALVSHTA